MLGFIRKTDPGVLHAAEGLLGLDETYTVDHEFEVVAVPFLVGIKYRSEELFASLRLGDLLTRIDERTALYTNGTRRDAGFSSKAEHGVLLSVSAGVERNDLPFAGVHLYFAPGSRGLRGQSHLTWLSVFVSL